jgi:hypothetical protein
MYHNDVRPWINNPLNLCGEGFESAALFVIVPVAIVDAADPADDVAKAPLGNIGIDAGARHERPRCAPKIVQRPRRDA